MPVLLDRLKSLGGDRGLYVSASVKSSVDKILDIGCSYGWALADLSSRANELFGVDVDEAALAQARAHYPHIHFFLQTGARLPFEDDFFDVVILSEVIEHVGDENKRPVMDEAHRVLKPGGLFVFTAPYAGVLAWADPLDFKRRFPKIYRAYMRRSGYQPTTSIEVGHKHVSMPEIWRLLAKRFVLEDVHYCGLLTPFLTWVTAAGARLKMIPPPVEHRLNYLRGWESGVEVPRFLASSVRLTARKKRSVTSGANAR